MIKGRYMEIAAAGTNVKEGKGKKVKLETTTKTARKSMLITAKKGGGLNINILTDWGGPLETHSHLMGRSVHCTGRGGHD